MANIIDSYSESNQSGGNDLYAANYTGTGQAFTGNGSAIGSSVFYLKKTGSPTGNAVSKIYSITGTFGTSAKPTGAALATSDNFDVSTLTTSYALSTFTFSGANQITLTNATKYAVDVEYTGGTSSNKVTIGYDFTSPTHAGNEFEAFTIGTWTAQSGTDACFYVYDNGAATQTISPDSISSGSGLYTPSLSPGQVNISPSAISTGSQLYTPTSVAGAVNIAPNYLSNNAIVYPPTLTFDQTIAPTNISSSLSIYVPSFDTLLPYRLLRGSKGAIGARGTVSSRGVLRGPRTYRPPRSY